jgi:hypothetical protein
MLAARPVDLATQVAPPSEVDRRYAASELNPTAQQTLSLVQSTLRSQVSVLNETGPGGACAVQVAPPSEVATIAATIGAPEVGCTPTAQQWVVSGHEIPERKATDDGKPEESFDHETPALAVEMTNGALPMAPAIQQSLVVGQEIWNLPRVPLDWAITAGGATARHEPPPFAVTNTTKLPLVAPTA